MLQSVSLEKKVGAKGWKVDKRGRLAGRGLDIKWYFLFSQGSLSSYGSEKSEEHLEKWWVVFGCVAVLMGDVF